jgi:hypothetical protein
MKRLILWCAVLCVFALPIAVLALVWLALDHRPLVPPAAALTPEQIRRAEQLVKGQDPRRSPDGTLQTLTVTTGDMELAANYLLGRYDGSVKLVLQPGVLTFWASAPVPPNPLGGYVNVEGALRQTSGLPEFDELRIGRVPVPAPLADWMLAHALARLPAADAGQPAIDLVQRVRIDPAQVQVVYRWREALLTRAREVAVPPQDVPRLQAYQQRLVEIAAQAATARELPLRLLLDQLFGLAAERSQDADAPAENRAALLAVAFYVNGRGLTAIVPQAAEWPRPQPRTVVLRGRRDLAQHFAVSAALAAAAGTPLADAVGVYKEVQDSRGGSGFSFPDLAADRAGSTFGARAIEPKTARALQQRLAGGAGESDFMPAFSDLPEGLNEQELQRRFGGVGGPEYQRMQAEIDRRVAALALFRFK